MIAQVIAMWRLLTSDIVMSDVEERAVRAEQHGGGVAYQKPSSQDLATEQSPPIGAVRLARANLFDISPAKHPISNTVADSFPPIGSGLRPRLTDLVPPHNYPSARARSSLSFAQSTSRHTTSLEPVLDCPATAASEE